MRNISRIIFLFHAFFLITISTFAEGTKELMPSSGTPTRILIARGTVGGQQRDPFAVEGEDADYRLFIHISNHATEMIYFGLGANSGSALNWRIHAPDGSIAWPVPPATAQTPITGQTGFINNYTEAFNGPASLTPGGYNALSLDPTANGDYYMTFEISNGSDRAFDFFDITVVNTDLTPDEAIPGRVFSKCWQIRNPQIGTGPSYYTFSGLMYILSADGIVTKFDPNNCEGRDFSFSSNASGCYQINPPAMPSNEARRSQLGRHNYPQYPIFLNNPDEDAYPSGVIGELVIPPPPTPAVITTTHCATGTIDFEFSVTQPGSVQIDLMLNAALGSPYVDRQIVQNVVKFGNTVTWDGFDGATPPNAVPNNTLFNFSLTYINGMTHLPLYDVEVNSGFRVFLVRPPSSDPKFFWDDVHISGGTANLTGCQSSPTSTCHPWSDSQGNVNTINTWWYVSNTSTAPAMITERRLPGVLSAINGDPDVCEGETVTYSVNLEQNSTSYSWTHPGGTVVTTLPTITIDFTGMPIGPDLLKVQGLNDCGSGPKSTLPITIHALPVATITGADAVCKNSTHNYSTQTGMANYIWIVSAGGTINSGAGTNLISVSWPAFGVQTLSISYDDPFGCGVPTPAVKNISVNPLPTATITGTTEVCKNSTPPSITLSGADATPPYTFTYNINGGPDLTTTSIGNTAVLAVPTNTAGTFVYNLLKVEDASLSVCSQIQTGSATVVVNPLPTASITGTTAVCQNSSSPVITFTGATATPPYTFTYKINGGPDLTITSIGNNVTLAVPTGTPGIFTYELISVKDATLTTCNQPQTGNAVVTVNPLPAGTVSGTIAICLNSTPPDVTFTGSAGTPPYTFTYNINGGPDLFTTGTGNTAVLPVPTGTAGIFNYNLLSVQDASATSCSQTQTGTATISVNPLPTASISGTTAVCRNSASPVITFTGAASTPPYTFTYNINGGPDLTATSIGNSVTVSVPATAAGTFQYNLLSVQDASSTACNQAQTGTATINVNPLPTATVSGTMDVCLNSPSPDITFTGAAATPPYTFTYNINGGPDLFTTSTGNTATVPVPTSVTGSYTYNLLNVQDASSTTCNQIQTGSATVNVKPLPTATISGNIDLCQNAAPGVVTFTGASATPPYTFTYNINGGPVLSITSTGNTATVSAPATTVGTFAYNLLSVTDAGTATCTQVQNGTATVIVNPLPVATIGGTIAVCRNAPAPLITFTGGAATPPYTFTYTINGGPDLTVTSIGNIATVIVPTTVAGVYQYNLISVQDASSTICTQLQNGLATVTVNALPTAIISGATTICQNASSPAITFTGASATPPYTFTYNINGGPDLTATSIGNTSVISAPTSSAGIFVYNLVSVKDASLTACSQIQSGSATVNVNPLPTAAISGSTAVCMNSAAPLVTFTGSAATSPYTFTYTINGGSNQQAVTTSGNSVNVTAPTGTPGVFTYNLVSVVDGTSTACSQPQTGTATITVNSLPVPTITGPGANCLNSTSNYSTQNGSGESGYVWNLLSGGVITNQTTFEPTVTWTSTGTHVINVNYTDVNGCTAANPVSKSVVINTLPYPTITGNPAVCAGETKPYVTEPGALSYSWIYPPLESTVISGGGTDQNFIEIQWNVPGIKTLSVNYVIGTGCTATVPTALPVTVNIMPDPHISGPAFPICGYSSQNYSAGSTGHIYEWAPTGGVIQSGGGTNSIWVLWGNSLPVYLDLVERIAYTGVICSASASTLLVSFKPWPVIPGAIAGSPSVCKLSTYTYTVPPIQNATSHRWEYTGTGHTISGNGSNTISITFTNGATSGDLSVTGVNDCGDGPASSPLSITVNPLPVVSYTLCNDSYTAKNAKPFVLKGGQPAGTSGNYYLNNPASAPLTGNIFNPNDPNVVTGMNTIYYRYTTVNGCEAMAQQYIQVVPFNSSFQCGVNSILDPRDNNTYRTVWIGSQCWMQENLRYSRAEAGYTSTPLTTPQTDNCKFERYCILPGDPNCSTYGGFYQWDELIQYAPADRAQGFCPPGWHIPNEMEWDQMIATVSGGIGDGIAGSFLKSQNASSIFKGNLAGIFYQNNLQSFNDPVMQATMYWTSTYDATTKHATARGLNTFTPSVLRYESSSTNAFPVRCVKD